MMACYRIINAKTTPTRSVTGHFASCCRLAFALMLSLGAAAFLCAPAPGSTSAVGDPPKCTNESLRLALNSASLPDCRAYEMISPPYKEGYPLFAKSYAANGELAILTGDGTLAGNPGSGETIEESTVYLAKRSSSGWQLSPLNASLSEFVGQIFIQGEADRGETLWKQHTPEQPPSSRGLYVRSLAGNFSFIGPLSPPGSSEEEGSNIIDQNSFSTDQPAGATSDYGHVVLEAKDASAGWSFDKTEINEAQHSLYEYSGTGNVKPVLVGVVGGKGSTQLIATCGTALGSEFFGSTYNALSGDGEAIFFTVNPCSPGPATAEVYARLHGAMTSATAAETVDVSANECTKACGVSESGKNFEGASEDGKLVFFTSTQKLTGDAVDGTASGNAVEGSGCGALPPKEGGEGGCNLYMYDFAAPIGARLKALSVGGEVLGVAGIAENGARVYYVSRTVIGSAGEDVYHRVPIAERPNLYVYDTTNGKTAFVATLGGEDGSDWSRTFSRPAEVAGESGRFLLLASSVKSLTPDDTGEVRQLFEYRAEAEGEPAEFVRVTKGEGGFNEDGNGVSAGVELGTMKSVAERLGRGFDFKSTADRLNVSVDGRTVLFLTTGQLSSSATSAAQGCRSLYEFRTAGALADGSVQLVSDGRDTQLFKGAICGPQFQEIDATGDNVLFTASDPLLPSDIDGGQRDVYDARVGGGFPPPAGIGSCNQSFCEGASSTPPPPPVADSASENGEAPVILVRSKAIGKKGGSKKTSRRKSGGGGRLARALRMCRGKPRARRAACERAARRLFGSKARVSKWGGNR